MTTDNQILRLLADLYKNGIDGAQATAIYAQLQPKIAALIAERDAAISQRHLKFYVWHSRPSYLAAAQAGSVAEARKLLLSNDAIGESGDGSCPIRDKARLEVVNCNPQIWYGPNAEFVLTDSAELEETQAHARTLEKAIDDLRAKLSTAHVVANQALIEDCAAKVRDAVAAQKAAEDERDHMRVLRDNAVSNMAYEINTLRERAEKAEADSKRLDWLDEFGDQVYTNWLVDQDALILSMCSENYEPIDGEIQGRTLREAIDAAIAAQGKAGDAK